MAVACFPLIHCRNDKYIFHVIIGIIYSADIFPPHKQTTSLQIKQLFNYGNDDNDRIGHKNRMFTICNSVDGNVFNDKNKNVFSVINLYTGYRIFRHDRRVCKSDIVLLNKGIVTAGVGYPGEILQ